MPLTDTRIRNARKADKPYKLTDAKGLYIEVRPTGLKLWRYRYRIDGKENVYAMGEYCAPIERESAEEAGQRKGGGRYTLEEARQERIRARDMVKQGTHPAQHRDALRARQDAENANTFQTIADEWLERQTWSGRRQKGQVRSVLEREVYPEIGAMPIRSVRASHIRVIMERLAARGVAVTAINVRQWCGSIFAHATITERADGDPTGVLRGHIRRPDVVHKTPLTKEQIPEFLKRIDTAGYAVTRIALKLLMLLMVRTIELREAHWSEFDLENAEWRIPAERMKKRELHIVPLPPTAVSLLRELHTMTGARGVLFPNNRRPDECMASTTLNQALRRLGYEGEFSAHGFRATAHTLLAEMGYDERLIEIQLAHKERNRTKASYNQYAYIKERRAMLEQYAAYIDGLKAGNVVPIKSAA